MKLFESRLLWGGLLILMGVLFLLENLGFYRLSSLFWILVFALAGIFFITVYLQNKQNWWSLIPALTLLSLGLLVLLNWIVPELAEYWGGPIVLGGIGCSFLLVYLVERQNWWAVIPGGVLLTLAVVAALDASGSGFETAGVFFLGIGLTFVLVALLPTPQGDMRWAWIPGGIMLFAGLAFLVASENLLVYVWPLALIGVGALLLFRGLRGR